MPTGRDYRGEYQRRKLRALARGLSLSQARGHPRAGERYASKSAQLLVVDDRFEKALREMRRGSSLAAAARELRVSREKLSA